MAKFHGKVGYVMTSETRPGVWIEEILERTYYGDVTRNARRLMQQTEGVTTDIDVSNLISIVADPYARDHFFAIRYVEWMGVKWTVSNVEVQYPRLILTLGGVYNGQQS